jgi:hypothetical protein
MKAMKILSLLIIITGFGLAFTGLPVRADEDGVKGLVITPTVQEIDVRAGQTYPFTFELANDRNDVSYQVTTKVVPFVSGQKDGSPQLQESEEGQEEAAWVKMDNPQTSLQPNSKLQKEALIDIPPNAAPGGYYLAFVFASTIPDSGGNDSYIQIKFRLTSLVFLNVVGQSERSLSPVNCLQTSSNVVDPFVDYLDVRCKLQARGNSYIRPAGKISFQSPTQQLISFPFNSQNKILMSQQNRDFIWNLSPIFNQPENTDENVSGDILVNGSNRDVFQIIGPQTITSTVYYKDSDGQIAVLTETKTIWWLPWKSGLIVLGTGLLIISLGVYFVRRKSLKNGQA